MDKNFWLQKWEKNNIAFHKSEANPLLVQYFKELTLAKGSRIFLPLCGKTLDIAWLLANGYRIVGAELIDIAIEQLFIDLGIVPKLSEVSEANDVKHYSAENIDIFVGDIFNLFNETLGPVDAIYDRAALVALPSKMRHRYTAHLMQVTNKAPQLLISCDYDQTVMNGPPFSISHEEVNRHYRGNYDLTLLARVEIPGGLKGRYPAKQDVWLLQSPTQK